MLLDSVAPLVNTISLGSADIRSATCWKKKTIQQHCNLKKEKKKKKACHLSGVFNCLLSLPSVGMRARVRVAIGILHVGEHGIQDPGILRERCVWTT